MRCLVFAGISWGDENSNFRNCRNQGNITLTGARNEDTSFSVYGIAMITKKIESVSIPEILQLRIQQREMQDSGLNLRLAVLPARVMDRLRDVAIPVKFL